MPIKKSLIIINLAHHNHLALRLNRPQTHRQLMMQYDKLDQVLLPELHNFMKRQKVVWSDIAAIGLVLPTSFVTVRLALAVANTLAWVHSCGLFTLPESEVEVVNIRNYKRYKPVTFLLPRYAAGPRISKVKKSTKIRISR